jgi:hypothetical protein
VCVCVPREPLASLPLYLFYSSPLCMFTTHEGARVYLVHANEPVEALGWCK